MKTTITACAFSLILMGAGTARADLISFSVNTASVAGTTGYIDFALDPGPQSTQETDAEVFNFVSNGSFPAGGQTLNLGGAGGASGGPIATAPVFIVADTYQDNDDQEAFTFGTSLVFDVNLYGPAVTSPNGTTGSPTTFYFSTWDGNFNPILGGDVNGVDGEITVNPNGTVTTTDISANLQATPEPGTFVMLGGEFCLLGGLLKYRSRRNSR